MAREGEVGTQTPNVKDYAPSAEAFGAQQGGKGSIHRQAGDDFARWQLARDDRKCVWGTLAGTFGGHCWSMGGAERG
jgi:hypothetical protein